MLSEERSGLVFTLVGGGLLVVALLVWIGFFSEPSTPSATDAPVRAAALPALKLGAARGRVVDAASRFGLATRAIEVRGLDGISDHWLVDPDAAAPGAFELRGLPAGRRCTVALSADGYVDAVRELEVEAGRTLDLGDVALTPLVTLVGQVVDASGVGVGPAHVELVPASGDSARIDSDAYGSFRFARLAPGRYALRATTDAGDVAFVDTTVDATGGGEQRDLRIEVFPTVALRGTFKLPVGSTPLSGVIVQGRRGVLGGDGRFEIVGLRAGTTRLLALVGAERGVAIDVSAPADALELAIDPAAAVAIATLGDDEANDLAGLVQDAGPELGAGSVGALVVRAVDSEGRRLAGARVTLVAADPAATDYFGNAIWVSRTRLRFTARTGECIVRGLDATSSWRIEARYGALAADATSEIEADATRELVLTLVAPPPEASPKENVEER